MAVIEMLEVRFQADISKFSAQLAGIAAQIGGVGRALEDGRMQLSGAAAGLVQGVAQALQAGAAMSAAPRTAGTLVSERFSSAIAGGSRLAALSARQVASAADFSRDGGVSAARSAGAALSRGFANGISSGQSGVLRAVNRVVDTAIARIRSALQIHSPSRVSFEMGGFFGEGFAQGISASIRLAERSVDMLSMASVSALSGAPETAASPAFDAAGLAGMMRAAVNEALGGTSIVIPLNVDGVKLGEASIRGINRVTRSTGRLMLEI